MHFKLADIAKCWVKYGLSLFNLSKTNAVSKLCGKPIQALEKLWICPIHNTKNEIRTLNISQNVDEINNFPNKNNVSHSHKFGESKTAKEVTGKQ